MAFEPMYYAARADCIDLQKEGFGGPVCHCEGTTASLEGQMSADRD